jgi:glucose/mannose-6-phosphate isomerase
MSDMNELHSRHDGSDMLGKVIAFPAQMAQAWEIGRAFVAGTERPAASFARVVVCGMGGSAIGGDLARSFLGERAAVPIMGSRDYGLARHLAKGALVVVSSYSGNTGETLSAYDAAREAGASIVAVTSGGELAARCERDGVPFCTIPGGMPPRSAIGFSLFPMLQILRAYGVAAFEDAEYEEALAVATDCCDAYGPDERNAAIELAQRLYGKTPFVYAAPSLLEGVARRWACQFNENAKVLAHFAYLPELNHNEIVGWEASADLMSRACICALYDRDDHPMTTRQAEVGTSIIGSLAAGMERFETPGGGRLARMLSLMLLGDFASVYLAYLNGVDPTPVDKIDRLKKELA